MSVVGDKLAAASLAWVGTPHVNMQRVRGKGVDCGNLLIGCAEDVGLVKRGSIHLRPYSNVWHLYHSREWFRDTVAMFCDEVPSLDELEPGDFLLYQYGRCISHGAIYIGNGKVVHAYVRDGVIISKLTDNVLKDSRGKSRLRAIYRLNLEKLKEVEKNGTFQKPYNNDKSE